MLSIILYIFYGVLNFLPTSFFYFSQPIFCKTPKKMIFTVKISVYLKIEDFAINFFVC